MTRTLPAARPIPAVPAVPNDDRVLRRNPRNIRGANLRRRRNPRNIRGASLRQRGNARNIRARAAASGCRV